MPAQKTKTINWTTTEFPDYKRGKFWYIAAAALSIALISYAVLTRNFLFAIIVLIFALLVILSASRKPKILEIRLTEEGVHMGGRFTPFTEIEEFAIIYDPPVFNELFFETGRALNPRFSICLEGQNPEKIKSFLLACELKEADRKNLPIPESLGRILKL